MATDPKKLVHPESRDSTIMRTARKIAFPVLVCGAMLGGCSKDQDHLNLDKAPVVVEETDKAGCTKVPLLPDRTEWRFPLSDQCKGAKQCTGEAKAGDFLFRAEFIGKPGDLSAPVGHYHMRVMDVDSKGVSIEYEKKMYGCIYSHVEFRVNFDGTQTPNAIRSVKAERASDPKKAKITVDFEYSDADRIIR